MKTSIVYVTIETHIQHEDDDDPEDLLETAEHSISLKPLETGVPVVLITEIVMTLNVGEQKPEARL